MKPHRRSIIPLLLLALPGGLRAQSADGTEGRAPAAVDTPPAAPRGEHVDLLHGARVADPYRWLERLEADETLSWARAHDGHARAFAARHPLREPLHAWIAELAAGQRLRAPIAAGDRLFYGRSDNSGTTGLSLLVRDGDDPATVLIDAAELEGEGLTLGRALPDHEGRRVAYLAAPAQSRWAELRVRSSDGSERRVETAAPIHLAASSLAWSADGSALLYERFDPVVGDPRTAPLTGERLVRVGAQGPASTSEEVVYEAAEGARLSTATSSDGRHLVVVETDQASGRSTLLHAPLDPAGRPAPLRRLVDADPATWTPLDVVDGRLYLHTDAGAPRGRIVAFDLDAGAGPVVVVAERETPITTWAGATIVGARLIVTYLEDARVVPRVFELSGREAYRVELPYAASIWSGFTGRPGDDAAFFQLSGLADPGSVWRLDVATGAVTPFARPELPYDADEIETRVVLYPAADGTRVPMYLVGLRGAAERGPAPVIMYGYGFGGWAAAPWFQPHMAAWLQLGGVWAVPGIRGGGEYGAAWREAGAGTRKEVTIGDFIAAAEWLVETGVSRAGWVVANGSSAGGPVAAAALARRPDLFGAGVLDFPLLDMLRYERFTGAAAWAQDYGSVQDPAAFRALLGYSPVHAIEPGACHPPVLVAPGERDEVTPPLHAYKYVAALRHAQACPNPVLLRVSWGAGHTYGRTTEDSVANWADQLSFLLQVLEAREWEPRRLP